MINYFKYSRLLAEILLILALFFGVKLYFSQVKESERLKVNQDVYGQKIGSLLKTLKSNEFIKYNPNAVNTAIANDIKPTQITHYIHVVDSFIHTDTLLIDNEIDISNEVKSYQITNPCYNLDLLFLPDTVIITNKPIYDLEYFGYYQYKYKKWIARVWHWNFDKLYNGKCINNCTGKEIQIKENIAIEK